MGSPGLLASVPDELPISRALLASSRPANNDAAVR